MKIKYKWLIVLFSIINDKKKKILEILLITFKAMYFLTMKIKHSQVRLSL